MLCFFSFSFLSCLHNHNILLCFCLPLSGGHVARPLAAVQVEGEGHSWESRHLLQEVVFYGNESRIYTEPEKNCTEPGRMEQNSRIANAPVDAIVWKDVFIH